MKALAMLDHVMLWVARIFAVSLVPYFVCVTWLAFTDVDLKLVYENTHNLHDYIFTGIQTAFFGALVCAWLICAWRRPTVVSRTVLGLSAAIVLLICLRTLTDDASELRRLSPGDGESTHQLAYEDFAKDALFVVGTLSMVWLALCPPRNSLQRGIDSFLSFAKPQS
jgi:hypothetical protein